MYRTFIEIAAGNPSLTLVPPRVADEAWHEHQTMPAYVDDCIAVCGRTLPHDPSVHGTPEFWAAWEATRRLFADRGIELPARGDEDSAPDLQAETCVLWGAVRETDG